MPKMKTNSGAKKRFRITRTGKIMRRKAGKGHLNEHKSSSRLRRISGTEAVDKAEKKAIRKLLGK